MYSVYSKSFATWALNDSSDLAAAISGGRLFQSGDGIAYEWFWTCLDFLVGLVKWFSLFIATMLFIILYIIISLASFLLVCRLFHFRSSNIVLMLDLFLWRPVTYRAALFLFCLFDFCDLDPKLWWHIPVVVLLGICRPGFFLFSVIWCVGFCVGIPGYDWLCL